MLLLFLLVTWGTACQTNKDEPIANPDPTDLNETEPKLDPKLEPIAHFSIGDEVFPFVAIAPVFEREEDSFDDTIEDLIKTASENGFTVIEYFVSNSPDSKLGFDKFIYFARKYNMRIIATVLHGEDYETRPMVKGDQEAITKTKKLISECINQTNSITGKPYNEDPTILAWGVRDIGSLHIEGTEWQYDDEEDYLLTGGEIRDLIEFLAQEIKVNAPQQLVFASVSVFFTGRDDIYDNELEQPGWITMQNAPSVDFWYWYVDSKPDYWGAHYTSPDFFLLGSVPFRKPFIAVLDPYMNHEGQLEAGLYTFETLSTDDQWRSTQLQKAIQFYVKEVGITGLGIYQWASDLQWDILSEIDKCFAITPKNPLIVEIFRDYATKNGWKPNHNQDLFVKVEYDFNPESIPGRIWSQDYISKWKAHLYTYRTIYEQLKSTALHEADLITTNEADFNLSKNRLNYWLQQWQYAYEGIPSNSFSKYHLELEQTVIGLLDGVSIIESGNKELGLKKVSDYKVTLQTTSKEFEVLLDN